MARIKGRGLRVGDRFWLAGRYWQVLERDPEGNWLARCTDATHELIALTKAQTVWVREPSEFEKQKAPGAPTRGKHEHRWKEIAGGRGRLCEVCGRGEQRTKGGGWKLAVAAGTRGQLR